MSANPNQRMGYEPATPHQDPRPDPAELSLIAARCFQGSDGRRLMAYLRAITLDRSLGPGADDAHLRHLEGQRYLVTHLQALIERGRNGPAVSTQSTHLEQ